MNQETFDWFATEASSEDVLNRCFTKECINEFVLASVSEGADYISLVVKNGQLFALTSTNGVLISSTFRCAEEVIDLTYLKGFKKLGSNYSSYSIADVFCLISCKYESMIISGFSADEKINLMLKTSHGAIFYTARDVASAIVGANGLGKANDSFSYDAFVSYKSGSWALECSSGKYTYDCLSSLCEGLELMGLKAVCYLAFGANDYLLAVKSMVGIGRLVVVVKTGQSGVHTFVDILGATTPSVFSSIFVGGVSSVSLPVFDTTNSKKIVFSDTYSFDYFNKIDAAPMPTDIVVELSKREEPVSSSFVFDALTKPNDPASLMKSELTVLDVYSALRMSKWESVLDKSMPLVKSLKTGINVIDKCVGKF